jgi:hypothetical protein
LLFKILQVNTTPIETAAYIGRLTPQMPAAFVGETPGHIGKWAVAETVANDLSR